MEQIYPEPTVGALIINDQKKILFVKSHKWKNNKLTVPGGHIELGESASHAIVREVKEETGLDVLPLRLLMIQEAIYSNEFHKRRHFLFLDFVCKALSSEVRLDNNELQDYVWLDVDEIDEDSLEQFSRNLLNAYRKNGISADEIFHA